MEDMSTRLSVFYIAHYTKHFYFASEATSISTGLVVLLKVCPTHHVILLQQHTQIQMIMADRGKTELFTISYGKHDFKRKRIQIALSVHMTF